MFVTGKVVSDRNGKIEEIVRVSKKYLRKKFKKIDKVNLEILKYFLWDEMDNLKEIFDNNGEEFWFVYYNHLYSIFGKYSEFLGYFNIKPAQLIRILYHNEYKKKYIVSDFPDNVFLDLFYKAIKVREKEKARVV